MPANVDVALARLEGVQRSGTGWRACCPACSKTSRSRKLSVSQSDEGRILLHCFAGCDAATVVQAAGLSIADLFPQRLAPETPEQRRQIRRAAREAQWGAALDALSLEAEVVRIAGELLKRWQFLSPEDDARLALAVQRITDARLLLRDPPKFRPEVVR